MVTSTDAGALPTTPPIPARKRLTLVALCTGLFLAQLDTTVVNLALPSIHAELHGDVTELQWVMNAYLLAFAGLLLTSGTLGDIWGRRRMFGSGLAVFVVGSIICALSGNLPILVAGRAIQGVGAALAIPQSLAILSLTFPAGAQRHRAMAAWSAVTGLALAAGPLLGGLLLEKLGWPAIFWLNVPCGLVALGFLPAIKESADPQGRGLDVAGQILAAAGLVAMTSLIVGLRENALLHTGFLLALTFGCLVAFVAVQRRRNDPMLPVGLLRRGNLPVAVVVTSCMTFGMYGMLLLSGMYLQRNGSGAFTAGVRLLAMPVMFVLGSPLVARLTSRIGPRVPMASGMAVMGSGLLLFSMTAASTLPFVHQVAFAMLGLGMALTTGPALGVAVGAVAPQRAGLAAGIANVARITGAAFGVAVLSAVLSFVTADHPDGPQFVSGVSAALLVGAVVQLFGAVVAATGIRTHERQSHA